MIDSHRVSKILQYLLEGQRVECKLKDGDTDVEKVFTFAMDGYGSLCTVVSATGVNGNPEPEEVLMNMNCPLRAFVNEICDGISEEEWVKLISNKVISTNNKRKPKKI